jgi:hypothetical protein
MPRPTKARALLRDAREGHQVPRVAIPRVTCTRCRTEVYALPGGKPRPHLRPARPGDAGFSELVPTRVDCEA